MLSKMIAPKSILEIGTFIGYSALCLAEGLTDDGKVFTLDIEPETNEIAKEFWARSDYAGKIEAHLGNAADIIPNLDETFDLVFIDADKPAYAGYYDLVFPKLRVGGIIIADNVLREGKVLDAANGDKKSVEVTRIDRTNANSEKKHDTITNVRGIAVQYDTDGSEDALEITDNQNTLVSLRFESKVDGAS